MHGWTMAELPEMNSLFYSQLQSNPVKRWTDSKGNFLIIWYYHFFETVNIALGNNLFKFNTMKVFFKIWCPDLYGAKTKGGMYSWILNICFKENLLLLSHFSRVRLCATPQMAAHQAPPSLGFSRQEHWSGLPFPSPMQESEKWKVKVRSLSHIRLSATPWTVAHQAPPSMGFSRQEYWNGLPLPSPQRELRTQ